MEKMMYPSMNPNRMGANLDNQTYVPKK